MQAPYDARSIANFLLDLAEVEGVSLTQLSLLKIIYFAHGWYLSAYGQPLIKQDFEAWQHGPVVKVVRDAFKSFGTDKIKSRAEIRDLASGRLAVAPTCIDVGDGQFLRGIFAAYHPLGAWQLSEMTHEPGSPWDRLWNATEPVGRLALRIRNRDIKAYFDTLPQRILLS